MSQSAVLNLNLHPKQAVAFNTDATEILYGGAAGGGKSHLMRAAAILWCTEIPGLQVYLFRRIHEDLIKNHMEGPQGFRELLAGWVSCGFCTIIENEIRFWNGSKIYLCHCFNEKDRFKYQGAEIHVLLIDELTHFTEKIYRFLRNRVRMVGVKLPEKYLGKFPRIVCGANPGGVGHQFVKSTFIENVLEYQINRVAATEGGMLRQFIPARLEDNPSMNDNDPGYEARLQGLGSEALVKAMRYGDWDIVDGAFFDGWNRARHVVRAFDIPEHWTRIRSMDWGFAAPFSVGWWAVASEPIQSADILIPRGCMVRYREWYGAKGPNQGLRLEAEQIAAGISSRERGERISDAVLDPACFNRNGAGYGYKGPTIAERMAIAGVTFRGADNTRVAQRGAVGGWDQVRSRLLGDTSGNAMMVVFETCVDFIRLFPVIQHDPIKVEDVDTDAEDHLPDETRYAAMSRPWARPTPVSEEPPSFLKPLTFNELDSEDGFVPERRTKI